MAGNSTVDNSVWRKRLADADPSLRVHLIGIGGAGLSAIASVLLEMGIQVSGSDRSENATVQALVAQGARFFKGQSAENITAQAAQPDLVLISSAVDAANPELQAAQTQGIPVVKRDQFLPALLAKRSVIAIAGAHGKSTTTAMIAQTLRAGGVDAGYIIGTTLPGYGSGSAGASPWFVVEADEYDRMFLGLNPTVAVLTNVEWDHPDSYPTAASFRHAFMQFVDLVPREGTVISCLDDEGAEQVRHFSYSRGPAWITYGTSEGATLQAKNLALTASGSSATLTLRGQAAGTLQLAVPGLHNVRNALAALAVADLCSVPLADALASLANFKGTARRFEFKGEARGVKAYDDYAHHPTEIEATLAAARQHFPSQRIWALLQPHTFSRTRMLLQRMADAFADADQVVVVDIYAAREQDDGSISAADIVAASKHSAMVHIPALDDAAAWLAEHLQEGDVLLTLGAGDGNRVGEMVLAQLSGAHLSGIGASPRTKGAPQHLAQGAIR